MANDPRPGPPLPLAAARRFALALRQAVHDAGHEVAGDAAVVHFWDDDSLHLPARGYLSLVAPDLQSDDDRLVQALFAAGFLGPINLLRPHRSEFIGQITHWQGLGADPKAQRRIINSHHLHEVREITSALAEADSLTSEVVERAIAGLRDLQGRAFVELESLAGNWQGRLARLFERGLVDMTAIGPTMAETSETEVFQRVAADLSRLREGRPLATAIDAAALASLIHLNAEAKRGARVFPRFFTSSNTLKRYYEESGWLRERLSFESGSAAGHGTIWRDHDYYFVRSVFPVLRLNKPGPTLGQSDEGPSLADLQDLTSRLDEAVAAGANSLRPLLEGTLPREANPISQLLTDFQTSRMSRIWLAYQSTEVPKELVGSLGELVRLASSPHAEFYARRFENAIEERLTVELDDYRLAGRVLRAVVRYVESIQSARRSGALSLKADLASVRWGLEYDDDRDLLRLPVAGGSPDLGAMLALIDLERLRESPDESARSMAMLLGMEEFDLANDLATQVGVPEESFVHRLMTHVAVLGSRRGKSEDELARIVEYIMDEYEELAESERVRFALGYAYAVFTAWSRSAFGGAFGLSDAKDELGWAQWTIGIVNSALESMSPLGRIYGVNHLVYVSTCIGHELPNGELLTADLERLAIKTDEYRFLDTVGFVLLRRASSRSRDLAFLDDAINLAERAVDYFHRASELVPGDVEVRQHLELARDLIIRLRTAGHDDF